MDTVLTNVWAWLNGLGARRELAFWVAASVLIHTLGALLAWRFRTRGSGRLGRAQARLGAHWTGHLLLGAIRLGYYVLFPFALVIGRGVLELQPLGLLGPADPAHSLLGWGGEWVRAAGLMAAVGLAGGLALLWGWSNFRRAASGRVLQPADFGSPVWETFFLQVHWAFYRAAPLAWFGMAGEGWAAFIGVGIVALEAMLDPRFWAARREPGSAPRPLLYGALCWLSALGFALAHNLWLVAFMHLALVWASARWFEYYAAAPEQKRPGLMQSALRRARREQSRLAQEEAQYNQRSEDQAREDADALEVADDVLVLLTHVGETRRGARAGADAGRAGLSEDLGPLP
jgi:hypothetical protein